MRRTSGSLPYAATAGLGFLLIAGGFAVVGCDYLGPVSTEVRDYTILDRVDRLDLRDPAGKITITAGDGPVKVSEKLRYNGDQPDATHEVSGTTLRLVNNGCHRGLHRCSVDYEVRVPAGTDVAIDADAGAVRLSGLSGDIDVTAQAGAVDGDRLASSHTVVRASAGRISLAFTGVPDSVEAHDSAGMVSIQVPVGTAYAVDARADAGKTEITVERDSSSPHRILARASAGKIEITH